jgi:HAD superfamily hydrolase (TIGR01509 family)
LENYFDAISDGNNITNSKPHPEVFLKAAEYVKQMPKDCLVVEDARAGVDAAVAAGMDCAAIGDAVTYEKATYRINSFSYLKEIL